MSKENIEITTIKITELNPAQYNPRKISNEEYNKLSRSINEYGLVDPIIINLNNNHIIGGHQRYDVIFSEYASGNEDYEQLILIKNGDIGWVFINEDLKIKDLNHEKGLNISLNKIQGEWDLDKLQNLFSDITTEGFSVELTGFDKNELKEIFNDIDLSSFNSDEFDLEDSLTEEEGKKGIVSNSKNRKEITCPSCGHIFFEQEYLNEDE